ncbi:proline racemase family protein [Corynebacterium stationis]|uniref:proline racemase family protein n=1 Tax=Corynebacterium stationis TaxID=1705 RepID=UPI00076F7FE5|nr:proline racemase family protein [Corynebacterium stationis]AMJ45112.1 hypothetical protein AW169_09730 [Corynebacterium stationis]AQX71567.1 hypothetical protein CA21670_08935 [Corynebacterium stationis]ASJ19250.1 hypothetical protein BA700_09730 [Corynebacterium stationis]HJG64197.1 proline racemase family protein [Corynebacterium stationis]
MTTRKMIQSVDVHAAGQVGRVVLGLDMRIRGATMADKLEFAKKNLDWLRRLILEELRGYPHLCAPIVVAPVNEDSHFGLIVMEQGGFRPMSGSNLICAVTAVVESGIIEVTEPESIIRVDTAVGLVEVNATVTAGRVTKVTLRNVPGFVVELDHVFDLPEYSPVKADIVFGGQFYVQTTAENLGTELKPENAREILRAGTVLRAAATAQYEVHHPENPNIRGVSLAMIHGPAISTDTNATHTTIMPTGPVGLADSNTWDGILDRSPCGTGTSARLAEMHARGMIEPLEKYVVESLTGGRFTGAIFATNPAGNPPTITPEISGRGWIISFQQLVVESDDPFPEGFRLGDIWNTNREADNSLTAQ